MIETALPALLRRGRFMRLPPALTVSHPENFFGGLTDLVNGGMVVLKGGPSVGAVRADGLDIPLDVPHQLFAAEIRVAEKLFA